MRSNIHLISNIYVIQPGKNMENDLNLHRQIKGRKAIRELLQVLVGRTNNERDYDQYLNLLTEEQKMQWEQGEPCFYADRENTFGFIKKGGKEIFENRCPRKQACAVYKRRRCRD